ncbi:MAG: lysostaphin resistance A-like protein [Nocardioidaceae bacterium]
MAAHDPFFPGPYHRLTRPAGGAWWRLVVGVLAAAVGFLVVTLVALLLVYAVAHLIGFTHFDITSNKVDAGLLLGNNLGLAALIPVALGLTVLVYQTRPHWVSSLAPGLRRRWLLACFGIAGVVWALLFVLATVSASLDRHHPVDSGVIGLIVVVLLTTPFQAAGEEYLFRGFLLQSLGATRLPAIVCCVLSAAAFATAHLQFAPPLFADRFLLGLVFAWLALRTGGLEAGIAIHAVNNITAFIPAALLDQTTQTVNPTGVTWVPVGVHVVLLSIIVAWLPRVFDKRRGRGLGAPQSRRRASPSTPTQWGPLMPPPPGPDAANHPASPQHPPDPGAQPGSQPGPPT